MQTVPQTTESGKPTRKRKARYFSIGPITGQGATITAARTDAHQQAEEALRRNYKPDLLRHRGWTILLWATPAGHRSSIVERPECEPKEDVDEGSCLYPGGKRDARKACLMHLAQLGWQPEDGTEPPTFLLFTPAADQFRGWAQWQLNYKRLREEGLSDDQARHHISGR